MRKLNFEGYDIPWHTQGALERWVENGLYPGGFLTAVLCNDLFGAVARADSSNMAALADITKFVYNEMPSSSWGSAEAMRKYCKKVQEMESENE